MDQKLYFCRFFWSLQRPQLWPKHREFLHGEGDKYVLIKIGQYLAGQMDPDFCVKNYKIGIL